MEDDVAGGLEAERRADERDRRPSAYIGHILAMCSHVRRRPPEDRISTENGAIITCCKRWPLIIDPQVQGIKWLKQKQEKDGFVPCLLTQKNWIRAMRGGIRTACASSSRTSARRSTRRLDPVLSRAIYKKGSRLYIKFGGEEMNYDPAFSLYMQTRLDNPTTSPRLPRSVR